MLKKTLEPEHYPPHPGEILREDLLPNVAMSRAALARHLDISPRVLAEVLREERPVTFELAQRFGAALGTGARYWIGLQAQYDIWRAEREQPARVLPIAWRNQRSRESIRAAVKASA